MKSHNPEISRGSSSPIKPTRIPFTSEFGTKRGYESYWDGVDEKDRAQVRRITDQVRPLLANENLNALQIGDLFRQAKPKIKRGCFSAWLKTEFGGVRTAQRYMREAVLYAGNFEVVAILPQDFLHQLSQKRVTEELRAEVVQRCKLASRGDVAAIINDAKARFPSKIALAGNRKKPSEPEFYPVEEVQKLAATLDAIQIDDALQIVTRLKRLGLKTLAQQVARNMERCSATIEHTPYVQ